MSTATKLFQPLTGAELRTVIEADFQKALDNCPELAAHLTHPKAIYKLELTLISYPMNDEVVVRVDKGFDSGAETGEEKTYKRVQAREIGETQSTAPDAIRIEHDLPITQPTRAEDTGRIVDTPVPRKITVGSGTVDRPVAKTITVGKGAQPRVESTETLDDSGNPIKLNSF